MLRAVHWSEIVRATDSLRLSTYIADKLPLFYRDPEAIANRLRDGVFLTPFKETLRRLPSAESFQESHFGEIAAALYAEDVLGLRRLYSKLTYLSAQNSNAYKMDVVLCDLSVDPVELVFAEVKSSMKSADEPGPPYHSESCYANIFQSFNAYSDEDREFDLQSANDHLQGFQPDDRQRVIDALKPYRAPRVRYAAFAIIDAGTRDDGDMSVLATRRNDKSFVVDVVGIETLPQVVEDTWEYLSRIREALNTRPGA